MSSLGGVFVDFEASPAGVVRRYVSEFRDLFGPKVSLDVRWTGSDFEEDRARLIRRGSGNDALVNSGLRAAAHGHFLVFLAPLLPDPAAIQGLLEGFEIDPLVGFTQPRFSDSRGTGIWLLPGVMKYGQQTLPRQNLASLPEHYLTTERLAGCLAVRSEIAAGFLAPAPGPLDVRTALLWQMCHARRRGYRNLVMNRVVVSSPEPRSNLYPVPDPASRRQLRADCPDSETAEEWFTSSPNQRRELLAANACRARPASQIPVLLDCRGVVPQHNGTSEAIFGILDGLKAVRPTWELDVLFRPEAAKYHEVSSRYPPLRVRTTMPDRTYAAAVCLNQPWHLSTVAELHNWGLTIAFNMLDTIAWDVVYLSNPEVTKAWHFIAEHADGLLFISKFTQDRFNFRFPVNPAMLEDVSHLSLNADDYREPNCAELPRNDHVLVFGNDYEHKAVRPTIELLGRAFPFQQILGFGPRPERRNNVTVIESGHIPEKEVDRLIATARLVVFPSHYEGFGLPVIKALSYARTVVVRSSPLWKELAAFLRTSGQLVEFTVGHELIAAVGKALAGEPQPTLSLGKSLPEGTPSPGWTDCARHLVAHVETIVARASISRWYARDRALRLVGP